MAQKGDVIENSVTGQRIVFIQTARDTQGKLLQYEVFENHKGVISPVHVHPVAEERFKVLSGTMTVQIDGKEKQFYPGDVLVVPPGVSHTGWSSGKEELHVFSEIRPAMKFEDAYETNFGLARDGKTDKNGVPNLLQTAVLLSYAEDHIYYHKLIAFQKLLFSLLAPIGKLLGYKATYPQYKGSK